MVKDLKKPKETSDSAAGKGAAGGNDQNFFGNSFDHSIDRMSNENVNPASGPGQEVDEEETVPEQEPGDATAVPEQESGDGTGGESGEGAAEAGGGGTDETGGKEEDSTDDDNNDDNNSDDNNNDDDNNGKPARQGTTTNDAAEVTPEKVEQARQKLLVKPVVTDEFDNYSPTSSSKDKDIMAKWKKYAVRDASASGLRLGVDLVSHTVGAMGSLVKLANGFIKNPFSDPTGAARSLVNGIVEGGALAQGVVDSIGMVWGIKDGVKQEDVAGTYKGAQYYKQHADAERVQAKFNDDIGRLTKDIYGEDKNPEDLADLLKNDIAEATNEDSDIVSRKGAQNRIVSWMKNLETMGDTPEGKRLLDMVKRQKLDATNDAIPKGEKYTAPVEAWMYYNLYTTFSNAITNVNRDIGAISARQANQHRHNLQDLGENRRFTHKLERQEEQDRREAEKAAIDEKYKEWVKGLPPESREFSEVLSDLDVLLDMNGGTYEGAGDMDGNGLPYVNRRTALHVINKLEDLSRRKGGLTDAQKKVYNILVARERPPKDVDKRSWAKKRIDRILDKKNGGKNRWGASKNAERNKTISALSEEMMDDLEKKGKKDSPEYRKWETLYTMSSLSVDLIKGRRKLREKEGIINDYLKTLGEPLIGNNGQPIRTAKDLLADYEGLMDDVYGRLKDPVPFSNLDDLDDYELKIRVVDEMSDFINEILRDAKKSEKKDVA